MSTKSLTIVLPVHNGESRLRENVGELLELASELTAKFGVLIIDDGSTDATFEVAEELASHYPQVSVRRHRHFRGLGATIDYAQRRLRSDAVIVHDGVTPINSQQVRKLWLQWVDESPCNSQPAAADADRYYGLDRAELKTLQLTMEQVHRRTLGFQLLTTLDDTVLDEAHTLKPARTLSVNTAHRSRDSGVGRIPALPRPKFLSALAAFAFGE